MCYSMNWDSKQDLPVKKLTKSVWGRASWITRWETENALEGFPAFKGPRGTILARWTGASKIYIREDGQIIELTERFGFQGKRNLDLVTYDSIEVRHVPNQYMRLIGWMLAWMWGLGLILVIWSYWKQHTFVILNFGLKSTTNEAMVIRIDSDGWYEKISEFEDLLNEQREWEKRE